VASIHEIAVDREQIRVVLGDVTGSLVSQ